MDVEETHTVRDDEDEARSALLTLRKSLSTSATRSMRLTTRTSTEKPLTTRQQRQKAVPMRHDSSEIPDWELMIYQLRSDTVGVNH